MEIQSQLTSTMSENGWKSIHVFYGTNEYEQKQNETTTTISLVRTRRQEEEQQQQTTTWYSQAHQDELIIGLLKNKTNGFFVDLAANDAIQLSNTL
jgi:outer membrane receptor for monomeric catechols